MTHASRIAARTIVSASVAAMLLTATDGALADTGATDESDLMHEIVVTARKREESVQSVPVSINAFSSAQLDSLGVSESKDIGRIAPGIQWKGDAPFGGNNIFVRGVGNNTTLFTSSPAVGVYLDETYFNSQIFHGFSTYDIERVEVLKGPQGTLYGRNTTGGTIKYITKQPEIGAGWNGDMKVDIGNFNLVKVEGGVGADLGENTALRLGVLYHDRDGIYYDYVRDTDTTDINAKALRLQLLTKPTDRLSILLSASYARSKSDDVRYKRVDTVDPASITFGPNGPQFSARCANPGIGTAPGCTSFLQLFGAPDDLNTDAFEVQSDLERAQDLERIKAWGGALTVKYDMDFAELTSASSYYDVKLIGPQDVDGVGLNVISIFDNAKVHQASTELRLTSKAAEGLRWVVGTYYFNEKVVQLKPVNIAVLGFGFGTTGTQHTNSVSVFGEATYPVTPQFDITAGLRWSNDRRKVDFTSFNYLNDGVTQLYSYADIVNGPGLVNTIELNNRKKSWSNLSGRVILSYKFNEDVMAYVSFNRGYKAGEFNFTADRPETATFVKPETVDAIEVGLKADFFDNKLRTNVAAFYYDYKDKQETLFDTGTATLSNADAEVKGVDFDITAVPLRGLTLNAGVALLDAKYKHFPNCNPDGSDCDNNRLPSSPKTVMNLLGRYAFNIAGHKASIQANSNYTGQRYFDFRNVSYIASKSYWLVDARATYEIRDGLEASLWVQNLSNKRYFVDGYDVSVFGYSLLLAGTPRTYGGSISFRF